MTLSECTCTIKNEPYESLRSLGSMFTPLQSRIVMYLDYHYYMIRVLAEKAGFSPADAQIIAYASQYVDDSNEWKKFTIENMPDEVSGTVRPDARTFDPVCTAHKDIQFVGGMRTEAQVRTYIPFHFVPKDECSPANQEFYDYRTKPDGNIARSLIRNA